MKRRARRYPARGIPGSGILHFVVAHVAGLAMLRLAAQRDRALDHVELGLAGAHPVDDIAHHSYACQLLERRRLAADDLERGYADARQIMNRAEPARPIREPFGSRAATVAVHVPDPIAIVGEIAPQPLLAALREPGAVPIEMRFHFRERSAEGSYRMMM